MIMVQDLPWRWTLDETALPVMEGKTTPKWLKLMKAHDRGTDAQQTCGLACTLAGFSYSGIINCLLEDLSFSPFPAHAPAQERREGGDGSEEGRELIGHCVRNRLLVAVNLGSEQPLVSLNRNFICSFNPSVRIVRASPLLLSLLPTAGLLMTPAV